jgi:hypothetical protein
MALTKKFCVGLLERIRKTPASTVPEDKKLDLCDYIALDLAFLQPDKLTAWMVPAAKKLS